MDQLVTVHFLLSQKCLDTSIPGFTTVSNLNISIISCNKQNDKASYLISLTVLKQVMWEMRRQHLKPWIQRVG